MQGYLSLIICLIGLVLYYICGNPTPPPTSNSSKTSVVGLHMFWVGLLAFLITNGSRLVSLFGSR